VTTKWREALSTILLLLLAPVLGAYGCRAVAGNAPSVSKVEPPSWWAGHSINPVRLLIRGANLAGAKVTSPGIRIKTGAVRTNAAGTYVFVSLTVDPRTPPGDYPLTLTTAAGNTLVPFRIEQRLDSKSNFQGINADDVIYLIMTDRFSDGDTSNDAPHDAPAKANDRSNPRGFHGGDLRGVINHLGYLKELGVTALWLTPWYDNWNGITQCDSPWCPSTYYHGYHAIDYYSVEDRFGDLLTLQELVRKAHELGLKVIQDQVANHVGKGHPWVADPPLPDWFNGSVSHHEKNPFRADLLLSQHASESDRSPTLNGWFSDDLPDMNQNEPEVARYEIQNALWWVGITGIDAVREDTIQYMPRRFIRDLSTALMREYPKMWMVGEVFDTDPAHTAFFIGGHTGWDGLDTKLSSDFDFPLWSRSRDVFTNKVPVRALRDVLKYDALYPDASCLTTMLNNHDVARFMSLEGATIKGAMLHTAFLISVRGVPQLYYGEELAMVGGKDPDNRRDFPGGFPGDTRSAFDSASRTPAEEQMFEWTRNWLRLRREHSAIRRGRLTDLFFDDDTYAFLRSDGNEKVVIAINRAPKAKAISISARACETGDNSRLTPLLNASDRPAVTHGSIRIELPAQSAMAYRIDSIRN
jgi:glycosidase